MKLIKKQIAAIVILSLILGMTATACTKAYRDISVFDIDGLVTISRDGKSLSAYKDMALRSGDSVSVGNGGFLRLCLDANKYVYLDENTSISLVAVGNDTSNRTSIYVEMGQMVTEIQQKLNDKSSFEVVTPNTTMAIRGTITSIGVIKDNDNSTITVNEVVEGKVQFMTLFLDDGKLAAQMAPMAEGQGFTFATSEEDTIDGNEFFKSKFGKRAKAMIPSDNDGKIKIDGMKVEIGVSEDLNSLVSTLQSDYNTSEVHTDKIGARTAEFLNTIMEKTDGELSDRMKDSIQDVLEEFETENKQDEISEEKTEEVIDNNVDDKSEVEISVPEDNTETEDANDTQQVEVSENETVETASEDTNVTVETEDQPVVEQTVEEQPVDEQPAEEQPVEEQPAEEQPVEEQPAEEQPAEEQPVEEQPAEEQPVEEQPAESEADKEDVTVPIQPDNDENTDNNPGETVEQPVENPEENQPEQPEQNEQPEQSEQPENGNQEVTGPTAEEPKEEKPIIVPINPPQPPHHDPSENNPQNPGQSGSKIKVNFHLNGGEFDDFECENGQYIIEGDEDFYLPAAKRENYDFEGWYLNGSAVDTRIEHISKTLEFFSQIFGNSTINVTARWSPKEYTIVYNSNGGSISIDGVEYNQAYIYNGNYVTPYELISEGVTKPGYVFAGWSLDMESEDIISEFALLTDLSEPVNLVANWNKDYSQNVWVYYNANMDMPKVVSGAYIDGMKLSDFNSEIQGYSSICQEIRYSVNDFAGLKIAVLETLEGPTLEPGSYETQPEAYAGALDIPDEDNIYVAAEDYTLTKGQVIYVEAIDGSGLIKDMHVSTESVVSGCSIEFGDLHLPVTVTVSYSSFTATEVGTMSSRQQASFRIVPDGNASQIPYTIDSESNIGISENIMQGRVVRSDVYCKDWYAIDLLYDEDVTIDGIYVKFSNDFGAPQSNIGMNIM